MKNPSNIGTVVKEKLAKSQAEATAAEFDKNAAIIQRMMDWHIGDYAQYRFDVGIAFLNNHLPEAKNAEAFDIVVKSEVYWAWFTNQWSLREKAFVIQYKPVEMLNAREPLILISLRSVYRNTHFLAHCQKVMIYGLEKIVHEILYHTNA